jgi:hypothetical protein
MIRIVRLSGKYYGYDMGDIYDLDMDRFFNDNIDGFVNCGDPVLLINDLDDIENFIDGVDSDDIEMVKGN